MSPDRSARSTKPIETAASGPIMAPMRHLVLPPFAFLTVLLFAGGARADLIDPAQAACGEAGTPCEVDGKKGVCKAKKCSKLDYSNPGPSGSPGTKQYDCVRCEPGAVPDEAVPADATEDEKADAKGDAKADAKADAKTDKTADAKPDAKTPSPPESKSSCSVGNAATSMTSVALGLLVLGFVARRRRK